MGDRSYRKISTGLGQDIRNLMNRALTDSRYLMGRGELNAELTAMLPDDSMEPVRQALAEKFTQFAKTAQDRSTRFELRGRINELALHVVTEIEKSDQIVSPQEEEVVDVGAIADDVHYGSRAGGELDRVRDRERAEAQEILRRANS